MFNPVAAETTVHDEDVRNLTGDERGHYRSALQAIVASVLTTGPRLTPLQSMALDQPAGLRLDQVVTYTQTFWDTAPASEVHLALAELEYLGVATATSDDLWIMSAAMQRHGFDPAPRRCATSGCRRRAGHDPSRHLPEPSGHV